MSEDTTTRWVCDRCGTDVVTKTDGSPRGWVRVYLVNPPDAHPNKAQIAGDLCNGPHCGGDFIEFMHGRPITDPTP